MKKSTISLAFSAAACSLAVAAAPAAPKKEDNPYLETITIIGSREQAQTIPGSGALIDEEQLRIETATDISQLMKTIPGTYIREEDGFGLRPNIGIRAAGSERSSKVTLLEDGAMIAPAPYSNPEAYYFPTTMRMSTVEVLKGAPLLRYGPQTTGGVVNLVSTAIPEDNSGNITAVAGEYGSRDIHAHYGGKRGNFGWLVETVQRNSDGFKDIDRSSRDAGFDIEDYVVKFSWEGNKQRLLFKAQYSEEVSNETYLGLTDTDFDRDEDRRYGLSEIDQMDNKHEGYSLVYSLELTDGITATATAYRNEFVRDWFKLGGGGSIVTAANADDATAQGILDGTVDATGLEYVHNNRSYESQGVELNFTIDMGTHQVEFGGRLHEDEMDRFQPIEIYDQINGSLVFQNVVQPTGSNNRLEEAEALSFWIKDDWQITKALHLNLALRYEDVETAREQFNDPARTLLGSERANTTDVWLPGASFSYNVNNSWQVLAGVHRGFSPLGGGAQEFEEPEISTNYEAGVRFSREPLFLEAIGFYSDFENKTENCSLANPCSNGATSGSFTTGEAEVSGLELQAGTAFTAGRFIVPVNLAYTYTKAELSKDNSEEGFQDGDTLADIPENTLSLRVGLENQNGWNNYAVAKYIDEMCVSVGCNRIGGRFGETESLFVLDFISRYALNPQTDVFLKVDNLFDERSIVSRVPDGARPNKPRTAYVGVEYIF
ncbi:MAG: TonB-dependent receptor [Gammaproteobacteria bacterium]|nr:TonB-dependent receptor [Gammaproteobacteria bacterium]